MAETVSIQELRSIALDNMVANAELRLTALPSLPERDVPLVIVGGGPSLLNCLGEVRRRQRNGAFVVACNGANLLLRSHGIYPDYVLFLDPQEIVASYIGDHGASAYLVSAMVHPAAMAKIPHDRAFIFHAEIPEEAGERYHATVQKWPVIPTSIGGFGNTVCLRAINIGHMLGFREFHMYGVDSSYERGGKDHAYVNGNSVEPEALEIRHNKKMYTCSPWMVVQADDFKKYHLQFHNLGCVVKAHGSGLLPDLSRYLDGRRTAWLVWEASKRVAHG